MHDLFFKLKSCRLWMFVRMVLARIQKKWLKAGGNTLSDIDSRQQKARIMNGSIDSIEFAQPYAETMPHTHLH